MVQETISLSPFCRLSTLHSGLRWLAQKSGQECQHCPYLFRGYSATLFKRKLRAKAWKRAQNRLYNLIETRKYGESMVHSWPHIEVTICQVQGFWYTFCKKPCTLNSHFCPLTLAEQWLWGCGVLPNYEASRRGKIINLTAPAYLKCPAQRMPVLMNSINFSTSSNSS